MMSAPKAIMAALNALAPMVESLSPFAKAIMPPAIGFAAAIVTSVVAGRIDTASLLAAGIGVASGVLTYLTPNKPAAKK